MADNFPRPACHDDDPAAAETLDRRPRLFLSLLQDPESVRVLVDALGHTALRCPDRTSPGHLRGSNAFVFLLLHRWGTPAEEEEEGLLRESILASLLQRHPNVALLRESADGTALLIEQLNTFKSAFQLIKIWKPRREPPRLQWKKKDFFEDFLMEVSLLKW